MEIAILIICFVFVMFMMADLNRMEHEMEQDAIRQDALFKAIDDYIAQEKDQTEFDNNSYKHDWEE